MRAQTEQQRSQVAYRERLWPGLWVWVTAAGTVGALAVAYGAALGAAVGWTVAALGTVGMLALMRAMAARIEVSPAGLRADRALLPWEFVGRCLVLDAEQARRARGPEGDPSAYLLLRAGVGPGAVVVEVTDPQDPHRTWLLATRHPEELARAVAQARGTLAP